MKKKLSLALALLMLVALLTGCGSSAAMEIAAPAAAPAAPSASVSFFTQDAKAESAFDYAAGYSADYDAPTEPMEAPVPMPETEEQSGFLIPNGVKLIYRADISLESTAFDTAVATIRSLTESCGGYFENSSLDNYSRYRYAYYTIRIPAEQFEAFCAAVSRISEEGETFQLNNLSRSAEDVSEYYYDTEARLNTQKTKLARLQDLLAKAENMEDIITLESAISETELAIENLTGTLRHYDSLVGYSTISVNLSEVYKLTEIEEPAIGFGAKLAEAFKTGCSRFVDNGERFLLSVARAWVGWLIFIVIVVIVILIIVRAARRGKAKRAAREAERREKREKSTMPPHRRPLPQQTAAPAAEKPEEK